VVMELQMDEVKMSTDGLVADSNGRRRTKFLYRGQDVQRQIKWLETEKIHV
jgi:hypothetical protein